MTRSYAIVFIVLFLMFRQLSGANITATLEENAGASSFTIRDSDNDSVAVFDSNGNAALKGGLRLDSAGVKCTNAETLVVDGKVGIGTDNPQELLHISAQTAGKAMILLEADTDNNDEADQPGIVMRQDGAIVEGFIGFEGSNNSLRVVNRFAESLILGTSNETRVTIKGNGFVGINTADPQSLLNIYGASTELLRFSGNATNSYAGAGYYEGASARWFAYLAEVNDVFYFADADYSNGAYLQQNVSGWTGFSDLRMKTNIKSYSVLDKLSDYRTVSFDWKKSGNRDVGVIGQEIVKAFPEVVDRGDDETGRDISRLDEPGVWGVRYDRLGALALQGVKELKDIVDRLEQENQALKARIVALEKDKNVEF
ncbi:MAG: tail fiber domain-containing protein [Candidatus Wallbacteria bacterium]|nr:tail fiber domain-containing protein [Candidatus Wallbacteria bacterium]